MATIETRNKQMFLNPRKRSFNESSDSDDDVLYALPEILGYLEDFENRFEAS